MRGERGGACPSVQVRLTRQKSYARCRVMEDMGIATGILNLRSSKFSSVETLIAALERYRDAPPERALTRLFQVDEAADLVLTNVAAHAAETMVAQQPTADQIRTIASMRRKYRRRFNSGPSTLQRLLFAASAPSVS